MPGLVESRTWDALLTTTLANYRRKLVDNIFDFYPFLSYLNGKLGNLIRGQSVKRILDGGESIVEQLMFAQNTTAKEFADFETIDTTPQEGLTIARFDWKTYAATVAMSGKEMRNNSGRAAMLNLFKSKVTQAEMSLRDLLSRDAYGLGTNAKKLSGLQQLISTTTTTGALAPGTHTWWVADVTTSVGSFAANGLDQMEISFNNISRGQDMPDSIFTTQAVYQFYKATTQPLQRIVNTKLVDGGFQNIEFRAVPVMFDRDCPSGKMYFLNSRYINWVVHSKADFSVTPMIDRYDQDAWSSKILLQANLTTNNRRNLGSMEGITA